MTLLREYEEDDHWPEYGTIVIRDAWGDDAPEHHDPIDELLDETDDPGMTGGTLARAGDGWLKVSSRDAEHRVRLEVHDVPPADDRGRWHEVVETPYRSRTGSIMLTTLMGSEESEAGLPLGSPGLYRARISCLRTPSPTPELEAEEGDRWRVQLWAVPGIGEPPRH